MDRIPELLAFLLNMLYNEDEQASVSQSNLLQNVLIQCLIHQVGEWAGQGAGPALIGIEQDINYPFVFKPYM